MSVLRIARMGEPILRRRARDVSPEELGSIEFRHFVDDLIETMRDAQGAGLAAPQVFDGRRVVALEVRRNERYPDFKEFPLRILVNPTVTPLRQAEPQVVKIYEGCLSVPGLRGQVTRPADVHLSAIDLLGQPIEEDWHGVPAAILQHEIDHLEGKLFVDRADPTTLTFIEEMHQHVPPEERVIT
jgi:peptide deformylase